MTKLPIEPSYIAPDGSEIRLQSNGRGGGLCHCTLSLGRISYAVKHKTVEEIWYFLSGEGRVWRKIGEQEEQTEVHEGVSLTIPTAAHFQYRTTGTEPLCFIIAMIPPWSGPEEALRVEDHWPSK